MLDSALLEKLRLAELVGYLHLEYFVLPLRWDDLADGGVTDATQQVPNDSDFVLRRINRQVFDGGTYVENPNLLMSLVDSGSGRLFNSQQRVAITTVTGTGQRNYDLPDPRIVSGGNALTVTMENASGGAIDEIHLALIGAKIFFHEGMNLERSLAYSEEEFRQRLREGSYQ